MKIVLFFIIYFFVFNFSLSCNYFNKPKLMVLFSSNKNYKIEDKIINYISNAKKELLLAAYNLTSKNIINSLIEAYKKGVKIKILLDGKNFKKNHIFLNKMFYYNIPIKLNYNYNIMHNKFLVIDNSSVETGSYNYTFSANNLNAENIIYLNCVPKIAVKYKKEFYKLWNYGYNLKNWI